MNLYVYYRFEQAEAMAAAINAIGEAYNRQSADLLARVASLSAAVDGLTQSLADLGSQVGELPSQGVSPEALASALSTMESEIVSKFYDQLDAAVAKAEKAFDAALSRTNTTVEKLNGEIAALRDQLANGDLTADQETAIEKRIAGLETVAAAMSPTDPTVLPPEPVPTPEPAPEPTPAPVEPPAPATPPTPTPAEE